MLMTHSERFAMLFAAIADIENDNITLPKENFGNHTHLVTCIHNV